MSESYRYEWACLRAEEGKFKRKLYVKRFKNELDAAKEYDRMAVELFGNKAILNFNE